MSFFLNTEVNYNIKFIKGDRIFLNLLLDCSR